MPTRSCSIAALIKAIEQLPSDSPVRDNKKWYRTQKEHWLGWLDEYHTPGYYGRQTGQRRDAAYAYNHIVEPKMLSWLIEAAGVNPDLVRNARRAAKKCHSMPAQAALIRDYVPWSLLADALWPDGTEAPKRS
jgi:hypothetical protein